MDERIPPPPFFQYSPSGVHSSPHRHNSMTYSSSDRERYVCAVPPVLGFLHPIWHLCHVLVFVFSPIPFAKPFECEFLQLPCEICASLITTALVWFRRRSMLSSCHSYLPSRRFLGRVLMTDFVHVLLVVRRLVGINQHCVFHWATKDIQFILRVFFKLDR